jgi:diguanylate cyclase (GGDEF)-like protein
MPAINRSRAGRAEPKLERRFLRQLAAPTVLVMIGVGLTASFGLFWAAWESDRISVARQVRTADAALDYTLRDLVLQQKSDAVWTPLVRTLEAPVPDRAWLAQNTGSWLFDNFNLQEMYILGRQDRPVFASIAGEPVDADAFGRRAAAVAGLLRDLRAHRAPAGQPVGAVAMPLHVAGIADIGGQPAFVSVMAIGEPGPPLRLTDDVMVNIRVLDADFLHSIARRYMLSDLHFVRAGRPAQSRYVIPLTSYDGAALGSLVWTPELPGSRILRVLMPISAILVAILYGLILWLIVRLWRAVKAQSLAITELQASEAQAQHLASHDVLTGLANRALLDDRLDQAMTGARRGELVALLALDLDRFKNVNDTFGHAAGDGLLKQVAARLGGLLRPTDTIARVGGDEFCIVLTDIRVDIDVEALCQRILSAIRRPFEVFGREVFVGMSIGVALAPEVTLDRGELLRKADIALYAAKAAGRNCARFFNTTMDESVKVRQQIEDDLRHALDHGGQLFLDYQPQIDARSHEIIGLEALVRWNHPDLGIVPPGRFVAVAEDTGLIDALGAWVIGEAARAAARWPDLFMAVNLSPVQFRAADFADRVIAIVAAAGCAPSRIELEITERVLLDDDEHCKSTLDRLRRAGFRIALDDFGSGYSSLSYLRRFTVDKIKIDRSYTESLGQNADSAAIVTSVVTLGRMLGLTVAAEGVETHDQLQALADAGCHELQGYLFSKPVSMAEVEAMLAVPQADGVA